VEHVTALAKHRRQSPSRRIAKRRTKTASERDNLSADGDILSGGNFSLHDLFQQQTMAMLDRSDLTEEQKQDILIAMNCPCCGAGGLSYTVKLKRRK
jgi:hypothetical protein